MTHDELVELIPLLAIDALPDGERAELRQHIMVCPPCASLLAEYQQVSAALLQSAPDTPWSPNLETRLRGRMRALQALETPLPTPSYTPRHFWQKTWTMPRWAALGTLAALLLLLAVAVWGWWTSQLSQASVTRAGEAAEITKLLEAPGTVSVNIKGTDRAPTATGQVILNPDSTRAYLIVNNLAPLAPDQVYQVWLTRDGQRDNAGTFTVDVKGHATARIWAARQWSSYQEIGVTLEPVRGSAWPTTPRLIGGPLH